MRLGGGGVGGELRVGFGCLHTKRKYLATHTSYLPTVVGHYSVPISDEGGGGARHNRYRAVYLQFYVYYVRYRGKTTLITQLFSRYVLYKAIEGGSSLRYAMHIYACFVLMQVECERR